MIHSHASKRAAAGPGWLFIETAGGVHSPAPSGVSQADLYLPLRCPVVLVGDSKLGGISLTISAFESLKMRGYDVESVLLFQDDKYGNHEYLQGYFQEHFATIPVTAVPKPPPSGVSVEEDADAMSSYYQETSRGEGPEDVLRHLDQQHQRRIRRLAGMAPAAHKHIWYPFTQHKSLQAKDIVTIDSANGDFLQTLVPDGLSEPDSPAGGHEPSLLQPSFDGSASWWTQGLGHANPSLTLAAAHAAGRYGHAMFAGAVHEPALALAEALLGGLGNPRLSRVFYSDNGSTGMEVAVKMALRAARVRYGWPAGARMGIVGLRGGYHGDTMGVMDCAEPSTFNEQVEWYEGKGVWLDYPTVWCSRGTWHVGGGAGFEGMDGGGAGGYSFKSLSEIFDLVAREKEGQHRVYEQYILDTLRHHVSQGRKFGALVIEPVVIGAGGMALV
ncbi:pyridoxal phosphate-dependent transferase [Xylariomycetidae sp. FL2044]|nr:pyridoxal phosphate-dependent transferase [Xylariomycetidae sp. FL2044]